MCEFCSIKPVFRHSLYCGATVYDELKSRKILCSGNSDLLMGADENGRIYLAAEDAETMETRRWYPNYCPVCGADLRGA
nr:MAG TPA: Protein involved in formate dehydrogenase formation [Caudoviricetes sp.]